MPEMLNKTVLVDMDDVLTDHGKKFEKILVEMYPEIELDENRSEFYFHNIYPQYADKLKSITRQRGFYTDLELIDGALEGWEKIIKLGYEPRVCSAPASRSEFCIPEKRIWLQNVMGYFFGDGVELDAIFDRDKSRHDGIALIDDKPIVDNSELASWQHIIFDRSYNQGIDGPRLYGWHDENLGNLLEQAQKRYHDRKLGKTALR